MDPTAAASSRYRLEAEELSLGRRIKGWLLTLVSMAITFGDAAPAPATKRFRIIDRSTGETAAVIDESTDEAVDLGSLICSELAETTIEDFERVWLSGRRTA